MTVEAMVEIFVGKASPMRKRERKERGKRGRWMARV
jgi:hypothetical protein